MILDCVIIGAGFAGLAAAERLWRSTCAADGSAPRIAVLEASDRVGGRTMSVPIPTAAKTGVEENYELGATWIHGTAENPLVPLCFGLDPTEQQRCIEQYQTIWDADITFVDAETGDLIKRETIEPMVAWAYKTFSAPEFLGAVLSNQQQPMASFVRDELENVRNSSPEGSSDVLLHERVALWRSKLECAISACDSLDELSMGHLAAYQHPLGPDVRVIPHGLANVARRFASTSLPPQVVHLRHEVSEINWNVDSGLVQLRCTNQAEFLAKHVICTVSLGVLKHWTTTCSVFQPSLPEWKRGAIDRMGFGAVGKLLLEFPADVSTKSMGYRRFLWPADSTAVLQRHGLPQWVTDIYALHPYTDRTFETFTFGETARVVERLPAEEVLQTFRKLLNVFYGDVYEDREETRPCALYRSRWVQNPYTRGSYSFLRPQSCPGDIELLAASLHCPTQAAPALDYLSASTGDSSLCYATSRRLELLTPDVGVLHFAGEATCQSFFSTVHGAILSGQREAQRVIKHLRTSTALNGATAGARL